MKQRTTFVAVLLLLGLIGLGSTMTIQQAEATHPIIYGCTDKCQDEFKLCLANLKPSKKGIVNRGKCDVQYRKCVKRCDSGKTSR